jgi:hypothetical protein
LTAVFSSSGKEAQAAKKLKANADKNNLATNNMSVPV